MLEVSTELIFHCLLLLPCISSVCPCVFACSLTSLSPQKHFCFSLILWVVLVFNKKKKTRHWISALPLHMPERFLPIHLRCITRCICSALNAWSFLSEKCHLCSDLSYPLYCEVLCVLTTQKSLLRFLYLGRVDASIFYTVHEVGQSEELTEVIW